MNNNSKYSGAFGGTVHFLSSLAPLLVRSWVLIIALNASITAATIPEPDTIFYGRVLNFDHGNELLVTDGQLDWTIRLQGDNGRTYHLQTLLELNTNGGFSYRLKVPHEALVAGLAGTDLSPVAIPLANVDSRYSHTEIRINGALAKIFSPALSALNVSSALRAAAYRIDLQIAVPMPDSDGQGLPDWWQRKYFGRLGTDPNADADKDGWSNLQEYLAGTDPTLANRTPVMVWNKSSVAEGATELLTIRAVDSDTPPERLIYTLTQEPQGAGIHQSFGAVNPGSDGRRGDRPLHVGDTFTQAQINEGRLVLVQDDPEARQIVLGLSLSDGNAGHAPFLTNLLAVIQTPTPEDGSDAVVWLDSREVASHPGSSVLTRWSDRSGPKSFFDGTSAPFDGIPVPSPLPMVNRGPQGQSVAGFNLTAADAVQTVALPTPDRATVLPPGDVTVFAVFNPIGTGDARQQLVSGANFQLSMAGAEDRGRANQVRFAADGAGVIYGNHRIQDQWTLLTAHRDQKELNIEMNDGWAGGPSPLDEVTSLGSNPTVGAKNTQGVLSEPFQGYLAELLVFNRSLERTERQHIQATLLSKWFGWVLLDGSEDERDVIRRVPSSGLSVGQYRTNFVPLYGPDRHYVLIGGGGRDNLQGGQNDDIIIGGRQATVMSGGGGRDRFVFNNSDVHAAPDIITDFDPVGDRDVIDLSDLLQGSSRDLRDYLRLRTDGHDSYLDIDFFGSGNRADHTIILQNTVLRDDDRFRLWAQGNFLTGDKRFPLAATLAVVRPTTTEAEGDAALINVQFAGVPSVPVGLELPFTLGGSAVRNVDYRLSMQRYDSTTGAYSWVPVDGQELFVQMKPGSLDFGVRIEPIPNSLSSPLRTVQFALTAVPDIYDAPVSPVVLQIVDALPKVSVTAPINQATPGGAAGTFQLSRRGSLDIPLDVSVRMTGPAVNGVDYSYIPSIVHFPAGQPTISLPLTALLDENSKPLRTAELVIETGAGYTVASDGQAATITILPSLPVIAVEAYEPLAVQNDGVPGSFLFHRRGPNSGTLTVLFEVGGTAISGKDYQRFARWVVFNPGATLVLVPVNIPTGATLVGIKTVALHLLPDPAFKLDTSRSAEVRLIANSTTFSQWKRDLFPANSSTPEAFALLDSDGDGLNNLSEYGLGFDPRTPDATKPGLPKAVLINGRLGVRFNRPVAALDVDYLIETSDDLKTWQLATGAFDRFTSALLDNGIEDVTFLDHGNLASAFGKRFLRLRLQLR